jgi:aminodeoxyfutalosine synthase
MTVSDAELGSLAASHDIISIGAAADAVRHQRHGSQTTFVRVVDVPAAGDTLPELPAAAGEIRIVGRPMTRADAVNRVRQVVGVAGNKPVSAFSLAHLEELSAREGVTLRAVLEELRAAGLELIAEAPFDQLQHSRRSIEEVNIAGLVLARLTMHKSMSTDPLPVLKAVADLQRAVAVIRTFAPLPRTVNPAAPSTGYDDVKRVALARVIVDAVPSIQVDWALYGPKLAQVALTMGADDVDSVSPYDDTTLGSRRAPLEEIRRNIRAAGLQPVERNGRFDVVTP